MRNCESVLSKCGVLSVVPVGSALQLASSVAERTPPVPFTYTYTFASSCLLFSSVCVCEPRQVCTVATCTGAAMFEMSKTRTPRKRSGSPVGTPGAPQSVRARVSSADMKSRFL